MINTINNEHDLMWCHEGSALAALMLQDGCPYVLCDVGGADGYKPVIILEITDCDSVSYFKDENGDYYSDAQPIYISGTPITYQQYLLMKQG